MQETVLESQSLLRYVPENTAVVSNSSLFLRSQGWQECLSIEYEATASLAPTLIV